MNQQERVLARIKEVGYVDNFWAIENYILRLGAIICDLSKAPPKGRSMQFQRKYGKELGEEKPLHKNFYYIYLPEGQTKLF